MRGRIAENSHIYPLTRWQANSRFQIFIFDIIHRYGIFRFGKRKGALKL